MSEPITTHPTPQQLDAFGLGRLSPKAAREVENHVARCDSCCQHLQSVHGDTLVGLAQAAYNVPGNTEAGQADSLAEVRRHVPSPEELPPELINHPRYRILEVLGRGGMGMVYKAEHKIMQRDVALKVISSDFLSHPTAVGRFEREVRAAAKLTHPNIVTAYDAEKAGDLHFLVMEYVDGISLASLVTKKGPVAVNLACHFVRQAALGLQQAHSEGMVHRDIKPHNLVVTRKGQLKILDFGLARLADEQRATTLHSLSEADSHDTAPLTMYGTVIGTPDYLAPEQAKNSREVDIRADIYALGCTFYYMLTGLPPFPGGSIMEKLLQHCQEEPIAPEGVPGKIKAVVKKMMAKNPDDRFQEPSEVAAVLAPFSKAAASGSLGAKPVVATPPGPVVPRAKTQTSKAPKETLPGFEQAAALPPTGMVAVSEGTEVLPEAPRPAQRSRKPMMLAGIIGAAVLLPALVALVLSNGSSTDPNNENRNKDNSKDKFEGRVAATDLGGTKKEKGKAILFVVPSKGLWAPDYEPLRKRLQSAGYPTVAASTSWTAETLEQNHDQYPKYYKMDRLLDGNLKPEDYSMAIFVGYDTGEYLEKQHRCILEPFLQEMLKDNKYITSICGGQRVLAYYGLLKHKRVAFNEEFTQKWIPDHSVYKQIQWQTGKRVVQDGQIITACADRDVDDFVKAIKGALKKSP